MSLNWKLTNIDDWEEKCLDSNEHLVAETNQMIWLTMIIGINEITEENYKKFYSRLKMYESLFGFFISYKDEKTGIHRSAFTEEVIKEHIGLWTNATKLTKTQFLKNVRERWERDMEEL